MTSNITLEEFEVTAKKWLDENAQKKPDTSDKEAVWGEAGTVAGTVSDVGTGGVLPGANVVIEGTELGAAADESGSFVIENVKLDNLVGFISQKNNITPNSYINTELLKDIFGDEKNNSYSNIKKLATDKYVTIVKNLNKSNQSMDNSNVTLYSIILLISIIIIISLLIFLAKYSF